MRPASFVGHPTVAGIEHNARVRRRTLGSRRRTAARAMPHSPDRRRWSVERSRVECEGVRPDRYPAGGHQQRRDRPALRWWLLAPLAAAALAGCPSDPPPSCVTVDTACAPLYAPTFDNIYTMTLRDTCGSQPASCHSAAGKQGGMSFEDEQHAFDALRAGRVMPGNPGCSKMIVRTDSPGASYQMPPGDA